MFSNLPPITKALLIANGLVFVLQWLLGPTVFHAFELWPPGSDGAYGGVGGFLPWQVLTYGFMHGSLMHLFFNMLALLMFGAPLEHVWGNKRFLNYYLICIVGAALCQMAVGMWTMSNGGMPYPTVGASGGVFGLLLGYAMLFPNQRIIPFPLPVPVRAQTVAIAFAVMALVYGIFGTRDGIAHFAHLGGMAAGWLMIRHWRSPPPGSGPRKRNHLRRVK